MKSKLFNPSQPFYSIRSCRLFKNFKKILFTLIVFCFITLPSIAQVESASLVLGTPQSNLVACSFSIEISDTLNASDIELQLGSMRDSTDLFSDLFTFDQYSGLSSGLSYSRTGNIVTIGIGTISVQDLYYGSVRIKNTSNQWGDYYKFIQN